MKNDRFTKLTWLLAAFALGMVVTLGLLMLSLGGWRGMRDAMKYAAVSSLVKKEFVGDFDRESFTDAALSAAVESIDDDWSYYMNPAQYASYLDFSKNQYQGIGVTIRKDETSGGFRIEELTRDGPAERAGVEVGEVILACDGVDVTGKTTADLKALIQADFGAEALLTLLSPDGTTREVAVSCEKVHSDPVSYEMLDGGVGYVRLENFEAGLADSAVAAVDALIAQGAEALVFDVRDNPGGSVAELCRLLDHLLPEGDIFIRSDKKGHEVIERSDAECVALPMAVLTDADSYSAAEFFAAALREYDAAFVAGEATTGKGRSQVNYILPDKSAVHLSHYAYLTPQRVDLSEAGGLVPDVETELGEGVFYCDQAEKDISADPQLEAAVKALKS